MSDSVSPLSSQRWELIRNKIFFGVRSVLGTSKLTQTKSIFHDGEPKVSYNDVMDDLTNDTLLDLVRRPEFLSRDEDAQNAYSFIAGRNAALGHIRKLRRDGDIPSALTGDGIQVGQFDKFFNDPDKAHMENISTSVTEPVDLFEQMQHDGLLEALDAGLRLLDKSDRQFIRSYFKRKVERSRKACFSRPDVAKASRIVATLRVLLAGDQ
jgi:hypothetical protein